MVNSDAVSQTQHMRLLIVTQVMDSEDPVLGFFCGWVTAFAKNFESIVVICLREGTHNLPENVRVHSLGKERTVIARSDPQERRGNPASDPHSHTHTHFRNHTPGFAQTLCTRIRYSIRFLHLVWQLRHEYDCVYVHMNQEYVLLSGVLWRILGKKVTLWRNHYAGSWRTDLAAMLCHKVFCTSQSSHTAHYKNTVFMPVGVSTDQFSPVAGVARVQGSILSLGRVSPAKKLELFLDACAVLRERGVAYSATVCGDALPENSGYLRTLKEHTTDRGLAECVTFMPGVPNYAAPALYSAHDIFVNTSPSGMFDKTMFEAMGCGCLLLASARDLHGLVDERCIFRENDPLDFAAKLEALLALSEAEKDTLRQSLQRVLREKHSLTRLAGRLAEELATA